MVVEIGIPAEAWDAIGEPVPESRLLASVSVNGVAFFAEAVLIRDGLLGQEAQQSDGEATIEGVFTLDPEGPFLTTAIHGREYLVVLYPSKQ